MLPEISLHILDIAQNSIRAGASLIRIDVREEEGLLSVEIRDDGCGMTPELCARAADPFVTTRTERRVGLGLALYRLAAEITGGSFALESEPGAGTAVTAVFCTESVDCMPLGDLDGTMYALITLNPDRDFRFSRTRGEKTAELDTRAFRAELGDMGLDEPEVRAYIREYLTEMTDGLM